jgi:hypothetical protein
MSRYGNTADVTIAGIRFVMPPRRRQARAWDQLRRRFPDLDGARVGTDLGGRLQVELEPAMGAGPERVALILALARHFRCEVRHSPTRGGGHTHWVLSGYAGVEVIIATRIEA